MLQIITNIIKISNSSMESVSDLVEKKTIVFVYFEWLGVEIM